MSGLLARRLEQPQRKGRKRSPGGHVSLNSGINDVLLLGSKEQERIVQPAVHGNFS